MCKEFITAGGIESVKTWRRPEWPQWLNKSSGAFLRSRKDGVHPTCPAWENPEVKIQEEKRQGPKLYRCDGLKSLKVTTSIY